MQRYSFQEEIEETYFGKGRRFISLNQNRFMKRYAFLIFSAISLFWSCDEKMKRVIEPGEKIETTEKQTVEEPPKKEVVTLEKIAEITDQGNLESIYPIKNIESETRLINEGMDKAKVIWINRNEKDEIRIDFRPKDSTKVFRITVKGRENPFESITGVRNGMSIDQVNSINRKPVDFYGFNWDFGGAAIFNGGFLEDKNIMVYFTTDQKVGKRFVGDAPHSFEEAKGGNLNLYVNKIVFTPSKNNKL